MKSFKGNNFSPKSCHQKWTSLKFVWQSQATKLMGKPELTEQIERNNRAPPSISEKTNRLTSADIFRKLFAGEVSKKRLFDNL